MRQARENQGNHHSERPQLVFEIDVSQARPRMAIETNGYRLRYARVSTLEQDEALQRDA